MEYDNNSLRTLYVASQCVYFLATFRTEDYENMIYPNGSFEDKQELIDYFYSMLTEKDPYYDYFIGFLKEEAEGAESFISGIRSVNSISRNQYAANLLTEIEMLARPSISIKPYTDMAEIF
jgi:hypothetical protein